MKHTFIAVSTETHDGSSFPTPFTVPQTECLQHAQFYIKSGQHQIRHTYQFTQFPSVLGDRTLKVKQRLTFLM